MSKPIRGTQATQSFYDHVGWTIEGGATVDAKLFGVRFDGKLRQSIHRRMQLRIDSALRSAKSRGSVLEVGCGGHPAE